MYLPDPEAFELRPTESSSETSAEAASEHAPTLGKDLRKTGTALAAIFGPELRASSEMISDDVSASGKMSVCERARLREYRFQRCAGVWKSFPNGASETEGVRCKERARSKLPVMSFGRNL